MVGIQPGVVVGRTGKLVAFRIHVLRMEEETPGLLRGRPWFEQAGGGRWGRLCLIWPGCWWSQ